MFPIIKVFVRYLYFIFIFLNIFIVNNTNLYIIYITLVKLEYACVVKIVLCFMETGASVRKKTNTIANRQKVNVVIEKKE